MRRRLRGIVTAVVLGLILWFVLGRLHIVIWVSPPWWGLLIAAALLFLAVDYILGQIFSRRP